MLNKTDKYEYNYIKIMFLFTINISKNLNSFCMER